MAIQISTKVKIRKLQYDFNRMMQEIKKRLMDGAKYLRYHLLQFSERWHRRWDAYVPPLRQRLRRVIWLPVANFKRIPVYPSRAPLYETSSRRLMEAIENPEMKVNWTNERIIIRYNLPRYYKFLHEGAKLWGWDKQRGLYKKYWLPARPLLPDDKLVPNAGSKRYSAWSGLVERFKRVSRRFWEKMREEIQEVVNRRLTGI